MFPNRKVVPLIPPIPMPAWLFATLALDAVEWARLSRAANAAEEEMRALLMKSFPETRAILDPAEQMRRGLEDLGAGSGLAAPGDMLFLLARAAPAIERESRVRVQGIEYAGRALVIRLAASEADAASGARALRGRSLDVEVQRVGGEARLRGHIRGAGDLVLVARHQHPVARHDQVRLDEVGAARKPILRWKPASRTEAAG